MAKRPVLRQAADLAAADFTTHSVWVHCHVVDYDEPWYDDTDEETFRPWVGDLPVDPAHAIFLVAAEFVFADGSTYPGFVTPASDSDDLATMQPHVFAEGRCFGFWGGMPGVPEHIQSSFYQVVGNAARVFPATFAADPALARGISEGSVSGFYKHANGEIVCTQ